MDNIDEILVEFSAEGPNHYTLDLLRGHGDDSRVVEVLLSVIVNSQLEESIRCEAISFFEY